MDVVVGAEAEGARRATGDSGPMTTSRATAPDPEVPAKVTCRRFSVEYRLRILKLADACKKPGDVGALLRREGLYSADLTQWRQQRERGALAGMRARKRGPPAHPVALLRGSKTDPQRPLPTDPLTTDSVRRRPTTLSHLIEDVTCEDGLRLLPRPTSSRP